MSLECKDKTDWKGRRNEGDSDEDREWSLREDTVKTGRKKQEQSETEHREKRQESRRQREEKSDSQRWRNWAEIEGNPSEILEENRPNKWGEKTVKNQDKGKCKWGEKKVQNVDTNE